MYKIDFSWVDSSITTHTHKMTRARQITTRSISKIQPYHTMTTRSGMMYKPLIGKKTKHGIENKHGIKKHESFAPPVVEPVIPPLVFAEFVEKAYGAINEVLQLYRVNPNDQNLGFLQEAVSLTVQLHTHCRNTGVNMSIIS